MLMVGELVRKMTTLIMLEGVRLVQIFWRAIWQNYTTSNFLQEDNKSSRIFFSLPFPSLSPKNFQCSFNSNLVPLE